MAGLDQLLGDFILILPVLVFSMVAHEYAHGAAALAQGDDTAYMLGRLTLNPLPHIDPVQSILIPGVMFFATSGRFVFGGAKPIPVNTRKFRNFRRGDLIVSSAGVLTNAVLVLVFAVLFVLLRYAADATGATAPLETAQRMMMWGVYLNLLLAVFNSLPIPPLDGSKVFYHVLPARLGAHYRSLDRLGVMPLILLLVFLNPLLQMLLAPVGWGYGTLARVLAPFAVGPSWNALGG
jgi:Zn-dependent protease